MAIQIWTYTNEFRPFVTHVGGKFLCFWCRQLCSLSFQRVRGPASAPARCKVSVMAQAAAELSEAVPYDSLQPFQDHFHPVIPKQGEINHRQGLNERRTGNPMSAISVIPLQNQVIYVSTLLHLHQTDLLSRQSKLETSITGISAFASFSSKKRQPLKNVSGVLDTNYPPFPRWSSYSHTLSLLGPGAKNILPRLIDKNLPAEERVDIKKTPRSLNIREWGLVVRAFKEWPFRPKV